MISPAETKWQPVTRWATMSGEWHIAKRTARYHGSGASSPALAFGLSICDECFGKPLVERTLRDHLHAILREA